MTTLFSISGKADDAALIQVLETIGVECHLFREDGVQTAQATIITDPSGHQFTAWYPGPEPSVAEWSQLITTDLKEGTNCFIQAPLRADLMQTGVALAQQADIAVIWCPGQFADQLSANEAEGILAHTQVVVGNAYEIAYLQQLADLRDKIVIETQGAGPVKFAIQGRQGEILVPHVEALDPTGCGDAFLAGVAHVLANQTQDWSSPSLLEHAIEYGIKLAHLCIKELGCQNHVVTHLK